MRKFKKLVLACDGEGASGKSTGAKLISKKYGLLLINSGLIYRYCSKLIIQNKPKNEILFLKKKLKKTSYNYITKQKLHSEEISKHVAIIAKNKKIRNLVDTIQKKYAYKPPKKFNGSCLDGRDITYKILPDADFKFFLTAKLQTRAKRRYKELKKINRSVKYNEVLRSIKKRDQYDLKRKISPLKITKDTILIDTTNLTIKKCFIKIKKIIDKSNKNKKNFKIQ